MSVTSDRLNYDAGTVLLNTKVGCHICANTRYFLRFLFRSITMRGVPSHIQSYAQ